MTATAAYLAKNPKIIHGSGSEMQPAMEKWPEAASQSFKAGQYIYLNSGAVTVVASDAATKIYGIAQEDASGTTGTMILVQPIYLDSVLRMRIYSSSGSAEGDTDDLTNNDIYSLVVVSNVCYVDSDDTTNEVFQYMIQEDDVVGAATVWGHFKLDSAYCQTFTGS